jgi:HD-like signal output (HDOD) protein/GGDEF domain-containing protein
MSSSSSSSPIHQSLKTPLETCAARATRLFSLPAVAMEATRLTANPKVDVRALKECIENDPALTTKILRVVNSSLFGLSREVSDLNQALAMLGTKPLKLLVLGFSLPDKLFANLASDVLGRYWRHALTKAVAARQLNDAFWKRDGDEAFIAGLLQDVGMLVLVQQLGSAYVEFLEKVAEEQGEMQSLERMAIGFSHVDLSARLLDSWGLPEAIVAAIGCPPSISEIERLAPGARELAETLYLAELFAQSVTGARRAALGELLEAGRRFKGLKPNALTALAEALEEDVLRLAETLALQLPNQTCYADVLAAAHAQLAEAADEATPDVVRAERARRADDPAESLLDQSRSLADAVAGFAAKPAETSTAPTVVAEAPCSAGDTIPFESGRRTAPVAIRSTVLDPAVCGRVAVAIAACRQSRKPLTVLLVELDRFDDLAFSAGPHGAARYMEIVSALCRGIDHPIAQTLPANEGQCAVLLPYCDRQEATDISRELLREMQRIAATSGGALDTSISIGAATVILPAKNYEAAELLEAADRCLYAAKASGGNTVKSIVH